MKKIIKKSVSVFLVIALMFCNATLLRNTDFDFLPDLISVEAKANESDGYFYYIKTENETEYAAITGTDKNGDIIIPSVIDGYPVKSINKNAFSNRGDVTSVVIPEGVTKIEESAFRGCASLVNIIISDSVTEIFENAFSDCESVVSFSIGENSELISIGSYAFSGCTGLYKFYIPEKVENIGSRAFMNCNNLAYFDVDEDNKHFSHDENGMLYNKNKTELITYLKSNSSTTFTVPEQVSVISDYAFYEVDKLEVIEINSELKRIGSCAFYNCVNLAKVIMPETSELSVIDSDAFYNCVSLESIVIPSSVTEINNNAFRYCESLSAVEFKSESKLQKIGDCAFLYNENLEKISLPASLTDLGTSSFKSCSKLKTVDFNGNTNLKEIKKNTFSSTGITNIVIPKSVEFIAESAFAYCRSLYMVNFESGSALKSIASYAFRNCTSLLNLILPYGIELISHSAFLDSSIMYVHIPSSVTAIAADNFNYAVSICSDSDDSFAKDYAEAKGLEFKVCDGTHNFPKPSLKLKDNNNSKSYGLFEFFNISAETENIPANISVVCSIEFKNLGIGSDYVFSVDDINSKQYSTDNYTYLISARLKADNGDFLVDENGEYIEDTIEVKVRISFFDFITFYFELLYLYLLIIFNVR